MADMTPRGVSLLPPEFARCSCQWQSSRAEPASSRLDTLGIRWMMMIHQTISRASGGSAIPRVPCLILLQSRTTLSSFRLSRHVWTRTAIMTVLSPPDRSILDDVWCRNLIVHHLRSSPVGWCCCPRSAYCDAPPYRWRENVMQLTTPLVL